MQPTAPVGTTTAELWNLYNQVPVPTGLGQSNQTFKLSDAYENFLYKLRPTDDSVEQALRSALGDKYTDWMKYQQQGNCKGQDMMQCFDDWASIHADNYNVAINAFYRQRNDPVNVARKRFSQSPCIPLDSSNPPSPSDSCFNIQYDTVGTIACWLGAEM